MYHWTRRSLTATTRWVAMHEHDDPGESIDADVAHRAATGPGTRAGSADRDEQRACPWCGSTHVRFVQRGLTGPTDERDQYVVCRACGRTTYEIISRTVRDMRMAQFRAGDVFRDSARQTRYRIVRVLKVGMNEVLLYLKPISRRELGSTDPD